MPIVRGFPEKIFVSDLVGVVTINDRSTGDSETLLIWSEIGRQYAPADRLMHGMWLSLLRDALSDGREVKVVHPTGDALILSVTAYA